MRHFLAVTNERDTHQNPRVRALLDAFHCKSQFPIKMTTPQSINRMKIHVRARQKDWIPYRHISPKHSSTVKPVHKTELCPTAPTKKKQINDLHKSCQDWAFRMEHLELQRSLIKSNLSLSPFSPLTCCDDHLPVKITTHAASTRRGLFRTGMPDHVNPNFEATLTFHQIMFDNKKQEAQRCWMPQPPDDAGDLYSCGSSMAV